MEAFVDQHARDLATEARNRLIAHEEVCAERWKNVSSQIGDLKTGVNSIRNQIWAAAASIIFVLATGFVGLIMRAVH